VARFAPALSKQELGVTELTEVELVWLKGYVENWIRFGRTARELVLDKSRRVISFAPGSIFGLVRWSGNEFGTVFSCIDILRAIAGGESYWTVPYVRPGAEILLRVSGWANVKKVLQAVDTVEGLGVDPAEAAPEHWRYVNNRLSVDENPRPYTRERHQAWLKRMRMAP
jgi:hypothetical protein